MDRCKWPLGSGETLEFGIYNHEGDWNKVSGLYIFAHMTDAIHWRAIYVGQAEDFSSRIPNHEKWSLARQHGATHIHAVVVPQAANRDTWEKRLIAYLQPPLNVQHRQLLYPSLLNRA